MWAEKIHRRSFFFFLIVDNECCVETYWSRKCIPPSSLIKKNLFFKVKKLTFLPFFCRDFGRLKVMSGHLVSPYGKFLRIVKSHLSPNWLMNKWLITWNTGFIPMASNYILLDQICNNVLKKCLISSNNAGAENQKIDPCSWKFINFCKTNVWAFLWTKSIVFFWLHTSSC